MVRFNNIYSQFIKPTAFYKEIEKIGFQYYLKIEFELGWFIYDEIKHN